jgi:hypothetical protein
VALKKRDHIGWEFEDFDFCGLCVLHNRNLESLNNRISCIF